MADLTIPAGVVVKPISWLDPGTVWIVPDYTHPETPMFVFGIAPNGQLTSKPAPVPDGRIIACHPDDEQAVRDAVAVAQERPQWWEDMRRFDEMLRDALSPRKPRRATGA